MNEANAPLRRVEGPVVSDRRSYRYQPLGSSYEAVTNCRLLLATLEQVR
ncbi:hypothetical protein ACWCQ1_51845 [Streptomyces sp. NPDC002144]